MDNRYGHLCNNSVGKKSEKFKEIYSAETPEGVMEIKGQMWHSDDFQRYLQAHHGTDVWLEKIQPQMWADGSRYSRAPTTRRQSRRSAQTSKCGGRRSRKRAAKAPDHCRGSPASKRSRSTQRTTTGNSTATDRRSL